MATESLIIEVNERGARVVRRNIRQIGTSARSAEGGVQLLRRALGAIGGALVVRQLLRTADAFTELQNRLRIVTDGTENLNAVTEELLQISNRTRSAFEGNVELFARLGVATDELGVSQRELLQFTESLNQAIILSGASATEAQAGLIQLSQGLASGALRGDELRSVLEQLPAVARVISQSLGVTIGELRELGSEGKITADIILDAFREARGELAEQFARTVPTVGQSFTILRNNVTAFIGRLNESVGVTRAFSRGLILLSENVDILARGAAALAITIGVLLAQRAIPAAIAGVRALTVAIAANPIGAIAVAATAAIATLIAFADQIRVSGDGFATLRDVGVATFEFIRDAALVALEAIRPAIDAVVVAFTDGFGDAGDAVSGAFANVLPVLQTVFGVTRRLVNAQIGLIVGFAQAVQLTFNRIGEVVVDVLGEQTIDTIASGFQALVRFITRAFNAIRDVATRILQAVGLAAGGVAEAVGETFDLEFRVPQSAREFGTDLRDVILENLRRDFVGEGLDIVGGAVDQITGRAEQLARERLIERQERQRRTGAAAGALEAVAAPTAAVAPDEAAFAEALRELDQQAELLRLGNREREIQNGLLQIESDIKRELAPSEERLAEARLRNLQQLQTQADVLEEIQGPQRQTEERIRAVTTLLDEGRVSIEEVTSAFNELRIAQLETGESLSGGFELGLRNIVQQAGTLNQAVGNLVVGTFNRATDALVQFAETGKLNLRDFVSETLSQLARLAAQRALLSLVSGFLGPGAGAGGGGGGGGLLSSLVGFQQGGQFRVPGSGGPDSRVVGFRASPGEMVSVQTPQQQRDQTVVAPPAQVQVVNVSDPSEIPAGMETPEGEQVIINAIQRNPDAVRKLIS